MSAEAKEYTGPASGMRDSNWLAVEDLMAIPSGQVEVTIAKVLNHGRVQFQSGKPKEKTFTLAFAGKQRELVLNATNRKRLVKKFGLDVAKWVGQKVILGIEEDKLPAGGRGPTIRVKE